MTRTNSSARTWVVILAANALAVACLLAAIELALVLMLNRPPSVPLLLRALAGYYHDSDRPIIQFMPDCAMYDPQLGYTLRPGSCRFTAREFDTTVNVNSAGLRDDEFSLRSPEVIVLGDSFAMGWGVEDGQAFPSIIERLCGRRVLNAGISSFGTARQAAMLRRLDMTALKWLVIQYSDNDYGENATFAGNGLTFTPMSKFAYDRLGKTLQLEREYFPGKHVIGFAANLGSRLRSRAGNHALEMAASGHASDPRLSEPRAFLAALSTAPPLPNLAGVIVLEINGSSRNDGAFVSELRKELGSRQYPQPWGSMRTIDATGQLTDDQYFRLDEHLSARGHDTVARILVDAMGCGGTI